VKKYNVYKELHNFIQKGLLPSQKKPLQIAFCLYLDDIVSGKLEHHIQGYQMGQDKWFQYPESELIQLSEINKRFSININREQQIRKTLLTKHDVLSAMKLQSSYSYIPVFANILSVCCFLGVFVYWLVTGKYDNTMWILGAGVAAFFIGMIVHAVQQKMRLSLFLPRIIVSVATAWFLLIASEEILKNQLDVDKLIIIYGLPLASILLIGFMVAEIKQHAPYYQKYDFWKIFRKTILVFIYTLNITIILGLLAHSLVVDGYIKRSGVYENYLFSNVRDSLHNVIEAHKNYQNKLLAVQTSNATAYLMLKDNIIKFSQELTVLTRDTTSWDTNNRSPNYLPVQTLKSDQHSVLISPASLEKYFQSYNNKIYSLESIEKSDYFTWITNDTVFFYCGKILDVRKKEIIKDSVIETLIYNDLLISNLINSLDDRLIKFFELSLFANEQDKLLDIDTYEENKKTSKETDEAYLAQLKKEFNLHKKESGWLRYQPNLLHLKIFVYPFMLMFQTILVLLLSVIGQLIVSDKTVTEAL
jgi:hypothetical protein